MEYYNSSHFLGNNLHPLRVCFYHTGEFISYQFESPKLHIFLGSFIENQILSKILRKQEIFLIIFAYLITFQD